jgi:methylated-DNA-[protein]-cysteine S-methyltransferase
VSIQSVYVQLACIGFAHVRFDHDLLVSVTLEDTAPSAQLSRSALPAHVRDIAARLERYARHEDPAFHEVALPLDGLTPFAARVLRHLQATPPGTVLGYRDLAEQIGAPGASRAVGGALARNRWLLVVPCHRVVRTGGGLGGFSGGRGVTTKRALLEHERIAFHTALVRG